MSYLEAIRKLRIRIMKDVEKRNTRPAYYEFDPGRR